MSSFSPEYDQSLDWLLTHDEPVVRYLTMRDLLGLSPDTPELLAACQLAHRQGPIANILEHMHPEGYWQKPGPGYSPKYRSTVWSLILLAQLGATVDGDERVAQACSYYLDQAVTGTGHITYNGAPGGTFDCLQGNMSWALLELGYAAPGHWDPRLEAAFDWMARTVTGDGIASQKDKTTTERYYAYQCGPDFACGANNNQSCAWGAGKVMLAFSSLPLERRTPQIEAAIRRGVDFLLGVEPTTAAYPTPNNIPPSRNWWKFGFPVFYVTDLLQLADSLVRLGYGADPRLAATLELIRGKADAQGRWPLEYHYASKTWGSYGRAGQPNPYVTLRALRVLRSTQMVGIA